MNVSLKFSSLKFMDLSRGICSTSYRCLNCILLAFIGAAIMPVVALAMMSITLTAVDLPLEAVAMILTVDRLLDMFRTTGIAYYLEELQFLIIVRLYATISQTNGISLHKQFNLFTK